MSDIAEQELTARALKKRRAIMDAAWQIFAEQGYERTTMEAIIDVCGGSKATIYSYFNSKEHLFLEASLARASELSAVAFRDFPEHDGTARALLALGTSYLRFYLNSDLVEVFRLAVAEGKRLRFGAMLYEKCFKTSWGKVADYLDRRLEPQRLLPGGGWTAAMHLRGLLDGDILMQRSWGVRSDLSQTEAERAALSAVTAFLRIYAPHDLTDLAPHSEAK